MALAFFLGGVKPSLSSSSSSPETSSDSARPLVDGSEMIEAPPLTVDGFTTEADEDPGIMATAAGLVICEAEVEEEEEEGAWIS